MFDDNNMDFDQMMKSVLESGQEEIPGHIWDNVSSSMDRLERRRKVLVFFRRAAAGAAVAACLVMGILLGYRQPGPAPSVLQRGEQDLIAVVRPDDNEEISAATEGLSPGNPVITSAAEMIKAADRIPGNTATMTDTGMAKDRKTAPESTDTESVDKGSVGTELTGTELTYADMRSSDNLNSQSQPYDTAQSETALSESAPTESALSEPVPSGITASGHNQTETNDSHCDQNGISESDHDQSGITASGHNQMEINDSHCDQMEISNSSDYGQPDIWEEDIRDKGVRTSLDLSGLATTNNTQNSSRKHIMKRPTVASGQETTGITDNSTNSTFGIPLSFGAAVMVEFTPRWSLSAGLRYTLLTRKFYGTYTKVGDDGVVELTESSNIRNSQHYIGIPVNAYFNIINRDFLKFYAYAGGAVEKCVADKYQMSGSGRTHIEKTGGFQWSVDAGIGVEFSAGKHIGIYIDPSVRYFFPNDSQPKSVRTVKPLMLGFEAGIRVRL